MFDFEAVLIDKNYSFDVLIKTINCSNEDFYYEGSSTIVGATIYLKNKQGNIIRPNDIPVTNDYQKNIIINHLLESLFSIGTKCIREDWKQPSPMEPEENIPPV